MNNNGFNPQGFGQPFPQPQQPVQGQGFGQQPFAQQPMQGFGQPQQMSAPGFEQMAQEFQQGYTQAVQQTSFDGFEQSPMMQGQTAAPDGWGQSVPQSNQFGSDSFGMGAGTDAFNADPFGTGNADPFGTGNADPFGTGNADPFGGAANPFGTPQGQQFQQQAGLLDTQPLKWWQKGARVFLLGGTGILLLAIIVFIISTNLKNKSQADVKHSQQTVEQQKQQPQTQPEKQLPNQPEQTTPQVEPQTEPPVQQQPTEPVQQDLFNGWQLIGDTDGYIFVETRIGEFIVQGLRLYCRNDGGIQVRSVAFGIVDGYPGIYEVDLPRSAALFDKITVGYKFLIAFDVYKSADNSSIFLENLRPDE